MKAVVLPAHNQGYRIEEIADPKPYKGEVVIKVNKAALCYRDLLQIKGFYPRSKYPLILGHEVVGTVEEVGENVNDYREGDRVTSMLFVPDWSCEYCKSGEEVYCKNRVLYAQELDGFFAEKARVKASSLVKIPENVSDEGAVIVPCVAAMVYRGLKKAGIKEGENVLVTGASGGVGIHAIQVAKALGAKVIGVTSSESKARIVSKFADYVIVGDKFSEEAKKIGDISIVIENVGPYTLEESMRSLRSGGKIIQIGNLDPSITFNLRLGYVILKDLSLIGHIGANKKDIVETLNLVKEGKIKPVIGSEFRLEDFGKALDLLKENKNRYGKILISNSF
ncbi:alcohol dehydrogenase [Saccharolobus solfataricus]|uniref:Alcohol dehydrogenase n=2 Tax=Saccharolobus solfataricus TaxID=2287 RepID=A0A0E3GUE4_SACSO|nr:acryloyl-coenzyme A reductase [Saccharolobus solfataricus]AKA72727.1 alcohol dehydrogenase [Saccharolobus solfataricus]AKA75426.1 alcohol dehydrogenase [Saccharolobus solfataricus]AKA78118.1 alcohol dehydrogenase [Saccharolobus solfataricus]AZF67238.1 alcohol dehydrogenase [Saccharolobus solfataricus]AZF69858.1 alcohol dehydrogenase [Saccharolobus solfataricus]